MSAERHVVLPFRPRQGWEQAGTAHRALATAALPLVLVLGWTILEAPASAYLYVTAALAVAYGALARVLRPYPAGLRRGDRIERRIRHGASALALAVGTAPMLLLAFGEETEPADDATVAAVFTIGVLGLLLAVVTLFVGGIGALARLTADVRGFESDLARGGTVGEDDLPGGPDTGGRHEVVSFQ